MPQPGDIVERYRVLDVLGRGGMARVYRVEHTELGSEHALKVLSVVSPELCERLLSEGRAQARVRHPNVVAVTDLLTWRGQPALVMERVDGPPLNVLLGKYRPSLQEALSIFQGVLRGVRAAHAKGLVHRDLKPENVLLELSDESIVPKVCDFGLVKQLLQDRRASDTAPGLQLGTPQFMAPEQHRDPSGVDPRADLWSLGCLLYVLVCHRLPFAHRDRMQLLGAVERADYTDPLEHAPDLPQAVVEVIGALLQPDPDLRLQSCDEVMRRLYGDDEVDRSLRLEHTMSEIPRAAVAAALGDDGLALARSMATQATTPPSTSTPWVGAVISFLGGIVATLMMVAMGWLPGISAPEPLAARVLVTGDASEVWLRRDGVEVDVDAPLAEGDYQVWARFDGTPVQAGTMELAPGDRVALRCVVRSRTCEILR